MTVSLYCYATTTCITSLTLMLHSLGSIIVIYVLVCAITITIIIYIAVDSTVLQQGEVQSIDDDAGQ